MRILLLQNHDNSGPGYLDEPAARRGVSFEACMPHLNAEHRLPADDSGYDGYLLMGGAMHAGHVEEHPWLEDAAALVRRFTEAEKPVLGICWARRSSRAPSAGTATTCRCPRWASCRSR